MHVFITNQDVASYNFVVHGLPEVILKMSDEKTVEKS